MKIKDALKLYKNVEIDLLLSDVLGESREFLFMNPEYQLSSKHQNILSKLIKRRQKGEPMAYILGYKDFYGLRFKVNRSVLIPRPETEMVVERIIKDVIPEATTPHLMRGRAVRNPEQDSRFRGNDRIRILDLGTGSGNIIISLAKNLKNLTNVKKFKFFASDVSSAALKVAEENAKRILHPHPSLPSREGGIKGERVKFIKSDLLKNIKADFDIIIANLPYGWHGIKNRFSSVKDGLKFEPKEALFTQENGLLLIRRLLEQIAKKKNQPKVIYLEFDPRQKSELLKLIKKYLPGWKIKFYKDYNNFWRYAEIS